MKDKRGTWSRKQKNIIWADYNNSIIPVIFNESYRSNFDFNQETICFWCSELILKCQYAGSQPNGENCWDIDHFDGNALNNNPYNLFIMHPWCNKEKGSKKINQLINEDIHDFWNKYWLLREHDLLP